MSRWYFKSNTLLAKKAADASLEELIAAMTPEQQRAYAQVSQSAIGRGLLGGGIGLIGGGVLGSFGGGYLGKAYGDKQPIELSRSDKAWIESNNKLPEKFRVADLENELKAQTAAHNRGVSAAKGVGLGLLGGSLGVGTLGGIIGYMSAQKKNYELAKAILAKKAEAKDQLSDLEKSLTPEQLANLKKLKASAFGEAAIADGVSEKELIDFVLACTPSTPPKPKNIWFGRFR